MTEQLRFHDEVERTLWADVFARYTKEPRRENTDGSTTEYNPAAMADEAVAELRSRGLLTWDEKDELQRERYATGS